MLPSMGQIPNELLLTRESIEKIRLKIKLIYTKLIEPFSKYIENLNLLQEVFLLIFFNFKSMSFFFYDLFIINNYLFYQIYHNIFSL